MPRTDPGLIGRLAEFLADRAGTFVQIGPGYRVTVDVTTAIDDPAELDAAATSRALGDPRYVGLAVAAALSLRVEFHVWKDGVAYRREYVDGIATGPMETVGSDDHAEGYRFMFDLDQEWLPPRPDPAQPGP